MSAKYQLIDGKQISRDIEKEIADEVIQMKKDGNKIPHLAAILVGDDPASQIYVGSKVKACSRVGFDSSLFQFPNSISEAKLLREIGRMNEDEDVDGFIVQLPLPAHISDEKVVDAIAPQKDVDGFTNENFGKIISPHHGLLPATPFGVMELLRRYKVQTKGKHAVVVGHSRTVGSPLGMLLAHEGNATVTQCHIHTQDLKSFTKQADILCVAVGKANLITEDMVKEGAVVIDIGINRIKDASKKSGNRIVGDVDFEGVSQKASLITPVPGGVGPMTIASLLMNTLIAAKARQ